MGTAVALRFRRDHGDADADAASSSAIPGYTTVSVSDRRGVHLPVGGEQRCHEGRVLTPLDQEVGDGVVQRRSDVDVGVVVGDGVQPVPVERVVERVDDGRPRIDQRPIQIEEPNLEHSTPRPLRSQLNRSTGPELQLSTCRLVSHPRHCATGRHIRTHVSTFAVLREGTSCPLRACDHDGMRVIAGTRGGRRLIGPDTPDTRP
jgi:hypothetical protein